MAIFELWYFTR